MAKKQLQMAIPVWPGVSVAIYRHEGDVVYYDKLDTRTNFLQQIRQWRNTTNGGQWVNPTALIDIPETFNAAVRFLRFIHHNTGFSILWEVVSCDVQELVGHHITSKQDIMEHAFKNQLLAGDVISATDYKWSRHGGNVHFKVQ